jgi:hypothetical protein
MALKPVLKLKVDELFLRWLSEPETQLSLKENLRQLTHGEALTTPLSHSTLASPRSSSGKQSPRLRPTSPPFSPPTSKLPSPRSPRRPLSNKNNNRNGSSKVSFCNLNEINIEIYILPYNIELICSCRSDNNLYTVQSETYQDKSL